MITLNKSTKEDMSENTKIEWADHTFNPWVGCTKVSPDCDHCYAEGWAKRSGMVQWGTHADRRRTSEANWRLPIKWNAQAGRLGVRYRVFCASLADVFDNEVPDKWRADLFELIEATPHLDWLLLTKRIGNVRPMMAEVAHRLFWMDRLDTGALPPNVWLGATICNQEEADRDIPKLLAVPAAKRFLSMEPLLGEVDLRHLNKDREVDEVDCLQPDTWEAEIARWRDTDEGWEEQFEDHYGVDLSSRLSGPMHPGVDWVIVGGESGHGARPMHPDWVTGLRDQCLATGTPFLFKQWGEWKPINQMDPAEHGPLYVSKVKAKPHEDQGNLDDIYGRKCTVPYTVVHLDGSTHDITAPLAFLQGSGAMQAFKVGKKATGRMLEGREWNGVPQ